MGFTSLIDTGFITGTIMYLRSVEIHIDMFHHMNKQPDKYNAEQGENYVRVEKLINKIIVISITPLMKPVT